MLQCNNFKKNHKKIKHLAGILEQTYNKLSHQDPSIPVFATQKLHKNIVHQKNTPEK